MTEKVFDPRYSPEEAAQQVVLELVKGSGSDLFKSRGVSDDAGEKTADFLIALHTKLSEYYRTLK